MKTKSKLLLCATSLLAVSVAASVTSAFAWFTAGNRQFFVKQDTSTILTNTSDLKATVLVGTAANGDTNTNVADEVAGTVSTAPTTITHATNSAIDLSGNGLDLYTRSVENDGVTVKGYTKVSNSATKSYYVQFKMKFETTNADLAVTLGSATTVKGADAGQGATEQQTKNDNAAKAVRIAVLNADATTLLCYYAPNETAVNTNFAAGTASTSTKETTAANLGLTGNTANNMLVSGFTQVTDANYTADGAGVLGTTTSAAALTLTFRLWFEGEDTDCVDTALAGVIDSTFAFNGVTIK